jgi:hypothetical protein
MVFLLLDGATKYIRHEIPSSADLAGPRLDTGAGTRRREELYQD